MPNGEPDTWTDEEWMIHQMAAKEDPKLFDPEAEIYLRDLWEHGPKWYFHQIY